MLTLEKAREWLRLDNEDNDFIIAGLLDAVPGYIEVTTGMTEEQQKDLPLVEAAARFLITLWYNAEQAESIKLQKTIDSLLKAISFMARE